MTRPTSYSLSIICIALALAINPAYARPIDYNEVSLLVRAHQSESSIKDEVAARKLMHPLTAQQESTLKSQGASDSLIQSLRNSRWVAPKEEVAAIETRDRQIKSQPREEMGTRERVFVFNVAFGHPINLSQWGGLDYEIAFYSYRFAGEDHIQPALIDQVGTRTVVSPLVPTGGLSVTETFPSDWFPTNGVRNWRFMPYNGVDYDNRGDFRDARSIYFSDTVGVSSYSVSRPVAVDWDSPVFFDGQPYTFYPVYGAGGVNLYYINSTSYSARVAVAFNP